MIMGIMMMMNIVIYVGIWWEMYAKCNPIVSVYIMFLSLYLTICSIL